MSITKSWMVINSNIKFVDNLIYTLNSFGEFWTRLFKGFYSIVIFIINFIFFIYHNTSQLGMNFWHRSPWNHTDTAQSTILDRCLRGLFVDLGRPNQKCNCGNWGSFLPLLFLFSFLFLLWFCFFLNDLGCYVVQKICLVYNWFVQSTRVQGCKL